MDYDARRRDKAIEQNRAAASAAVRDIIRFLNTFDSLRKESKVWVRIEDAAPRDPDNSLMESSISRELRFGLCPFSIARTAMMSRVFDEGLRVT
jgi:hypothetical protein